MALIQRPSAVQTLATKLRSYGELSPDEEAVLEGAVSGTRIFDTDEDIVEEGTSPNYSCLLLKGFAARYNLLLDGKRQITTLHVAGDFVDLHSFLMKPVDYGILAINTCEVAMVPHDRLTRITEEHPRLARMLWLNTLIDGAIHRRWVFVMGRMDASKHLCHLLCEMYVRMHQVGMTDGMSFRMPMSQTEVGDTLGLSLVHTNRVLQDLRAQELVSWERDLITIRDWDRLQSLAQFDATYLRMDPRQPARIRGEDASTSH